MIIGHGIDIIEVARVAEMMRSHPARFLKRVFTPGEVAYCKKSIKRRNEHLAARFAAKEAVMKALGTGLRAGISWTDIEVMHEPGGRPVVVLHGAAAKVAAGLGVLRFHLSLTHIELVAMASVIAEGEAVKTRKPRARKTGSPRRG